MAHKNKVLSTSGSLQLIQSINERGGKKYLIKWNWVWSNHKSAITEICDPVGNRTVNGGYMWKFNTRKEAEEAMAVAVLKGFSEKGFNYE